MSPRNLIAPDEKGRKTRMTDFHYLSARDMAGMIRQKQVSPVELAQAHLDRAAALQPRLNAFAVLDAERALAQARQAEAAVISGAALGPLHGVPLTIKSCVDLAGVPCACGSALRREYIPRCDAPLVARLKSAGAVILGNTNVPELLMAYETNNSVYGRTSNPWDLARTPGGSSGGEAAAIAAGCSAGGVGSDGGGSIRVPAHFSGICGLKPSPGRIPLTGHYPPPGGAFTWIGVVGPMARTVGDLRALFEAMAGPDAGDPCAAPVPVRHPSGQELRRLRIGVLESGALGWPTRETQHAVQRAAQALSEQGFAVEPVRLTGLDRAIDLWWEFFGRAIGHLLRAFAAGRESALSPMLREYLAITAEEPAHTLDEFIKVCAARDDCRTQILRQMESVPILLSPVSTGPAFRHGEGNWRLASGPGGYHENMRHVQWLNLAGFPGAVVPVGQSAEGLPIGVQVIGRPFEDEQILAVAERIEESRGPWRQPSI
jgi:Asp-tRNA(Asn)/Glu-tRNA(Gln) amidotransferase A subunit family amidase